MKILILSSTEGHESIAKAINGYFKNKKQESIIYSYADPILELYKPLYRKAPHLLKIYYLSQFIPFIREIMFKFMMKNHYDKAKKQIEKFKPDIVITTSWGFNSSVEKINASKKFKFVNLITDPRTFFPINITKQPDLTCVFDQYQEKKLHKYNSNLKLIKTGWFVKDEFEKKYNQKEVRNKLSLNNKLTFLFVTGWEGTETVLSVIKKIINTNKDIQIIIACGTNKKLLDKVEKIKENNTKNNINIFPIPFTDKLHLYVQAADLVIGKAGPNMLFETIAAKTPFFATTHIAGQEDGNLEIIREYNLGYVEENSNKAIRILSQIINNPQQLGKFKNDLEKMAQYNKKSKQKLYEAIASIK